MPTRHNFNMPTLVRTSTIKRDRFVTGRSKARTKNMMARKRTRRYSKYAKSTFAIRVKKVIDSEAEKKKVTIIPFPGSVITATPTVFNTISDVNQGVGEHARVGDFINPKAIIVNFVITNNNNITTYLRFSIVAINKQSATANYLVTDDWLVDPQDYNEEADADIKLANTLTAGNWAAFTSRFAGEAVQTIHNKWFKLARQTGGSLGVMTGDMVRYSKRIPLKGKINYDGATSGPLLQSKRYYLIMTSFNSIAPSSVNVQGYATFSYTDQ